MNFSAWSIRNPVPSILLFILLSVGGLLAFDRLPLQNFPDMDLPTIKVSASLEGASPSQLETEVARKIEDKLASLSLLDHITTTITDGAVAINVSFQLEKDSEEALNEVRNAVDSASGDLPSQMQTPGVTKVTVQGSRGPDGRNIMHDGDHRRLRAMIPDRLMESVYGLGIERARCLVEKQEAGPEQKDPGKDELLLLASGQEQVPALAVAAILQEFVDEFAEPRLVQRHRDTRIRVVLGRIRKTDEILQGYGLKFDVLGGIQGPDMPRHCDTAAKARNALP